MVRAITNIDKLIELSRLIGHTPMIVITYKYKNQIKKIFAKAEWYNLSGSIKDRVALSIYHDAYDSGLLKSGQTICETTSGNMGISLACLGAYLGHKVIVCMPKSMSEERKKLLKLYGAELVLLDSFEECFEKAKEYQKQGAFLSLQFENEANIRAHEKTTAVEIEAQTNKRPCFVAGVGTGGTLTGVGNYLKQRYQTKIIAVEPKESSILTLGVSKGHHKIQGLADDIVPKNYHTEIVDEVLSIQSDDAIAMAQKLNAFGLGVGISSGANFLGCVLSEMDNAITVFADDNKKYLSTELSTPIQSDLIDEIELLSFYVIK